MKWAGQKIDLTQIEKIYEQLTSQKGIAILNERFGVGLITNQTFDVKKVFHGLRESLPAVALPRNYFFVAAWPLNSAGKIDRQKLNVLANEEKLQKVNLNEDN